MMKMNRKKWLCGVAACLCLTGSTVPVFADTVTFNITIPGDIISKRSVKADDEQKFYVSLIRRIRKKIEPDPSKPIYVLTVWGIGYKFNNAIKRK